MEGKGMLKRISCLAIAGLILLTGQTLATDTRTTAINKIEQSDAGSLMVDKVLGYGSNYDLRNYKYLQIKSPGYTNAGWAIVATKLLELNVGQEFSAKHMDYATAANSVSGGTPNANNRNLGSGGNMQIALGYLASGRGAILEKDFKWDNSLYGISKSDFNSLTTKTNGRLESYIKFPSIYKMTYSGMTPKTTLGCSDPLIYTTSSEKTAQVIKRDTGIKIYDGGEIEEIRQKIKEHIIKYGAVSAQIYRNDNDMKAVGTTQKEHLYSYCAGDDSCDETWALAKWYERYYYDTPYYYYNVGNQTPNSNIVIIGWDDEITVPGAPRKRCVYSNGSNYI